MTKSILSKVFGTENVLRATHKESLSSLQENNYSCVIFDDMNMADLSIEEKIALFDLRNDSTIRILYGHVCLPRGLARVIVTNLPPREYIKKALHNANIPDERQLAAALRRLYVVDIGDSSL